VLGIEPEPFFHRQKTGTSEYVWMPAGIVPDYPSARALGKFPQVLGITTGNKSLDLAQSLRGGPKREFQPVNPSGAEVALTQIGHEAIEQPDGSLLAGRHVADFVAHQPEYSSEGLPLSRVDLGRRVGMRTGGHLHDFKLLPPRQNDNRLRPVAGIDQLCETVVEFKYRRLAQCVDVHEAPGAESAYHTDCIPAQRQARTRIDRRTEVYP